MEKRFRVVPRGVGLVIGCCTFPTWNGYPGLFASLATGNAVIVKPHPAAILPLAITVRIVRDVLEESGFDPERRDARRARGRRRHGAEARAAPRGAHHRLHRQPGERQLAREERAAGAGLHREGRRQPGRHRLDARPRGRRAQPRVLAVALHRPDVHGAAEHLRAARRHRDRGRPQDRSTRSRRRSRRACGSCSAIRRVPSRCWAPCRTAACSTASTRRAASARSCSTAPSIPHPAFPDANIRTPLIVRLDARDGDKYLSEWFGPIAFVIATDSTEQSLAIARDAVKRHGALTLSLYSTDDEVDRPRDRRRRGRRRRAVDQPDLRRVRQPVGRVLRLPRHRREPRRERRADRCGVRREPVPRRAAPDARLTAWRSSTSSSTCATASRG